MKILWLAPYPMVKIPGVKFSKNHYFHPATWIVNLADELSTRREIELHIITENAKIVADQKIIFKNITFHLIKNSVPFTNKGYPGFFPLHKISYYYFNSLKMNKVIREINPDIIHVHGTETSYAITALRSKFKTLISMQGIINEISKFDNHFSNRLQSAIERKVVKSNLHFACRTDFDKGFIRKHNPNAIIHHLNEAINAAFFRVAWICSNEPNLLFIGALSEAKGLGVLLNALLICKNKLHSIRLNIIGSGEKKYIDYINSFIQDNDLSDNIYLLGTQTSDQIIEELKKTQLFVLPTLIDNSPNSLVEAMAVGVPCIASAVGGLPTMIQDKFDGYLVRPHDHIDLAEKILFLLSDNDERIRISNNAKQKVKKDNTPNDVADETIKVYKKLLTDAN